MRILLVEDDEKVAAFIKRGLKEQGYIVSHSLTATNGFQLFDESEFDLIVLDVLLPDQTGYDFCRQIRTINKSIPVIMLTALGSTDNKLEGFSCGADDYLIKPFEFKELIARIKAVLRRSQELNSETEDLSYCGISIDDKTKVVTRDDREIALTAKEFKLLKYFLRNKERVLTRVEIEQNVWEYNFDRGTNVVDVYINFLRKKIDSGFETKLIHTLVGMGYILKEKK